MDVLSIDIETYSPVDLKKTGVYPYAAHPDFEILLFAYAFNDDPVQVVEVDQQFSAVPIPYEVIDALTDPRVLKTAYNAQFERVCLSTVFPELDGYLDPAQWQCTMVAGLYLGLPGNLADLSAVLFKQQEKRKFEGWHLIQHFCKPCKPTKANGGRTRNLPSHSPEKWEEFKKYNAQDVEVERNIRKMLARFPVPEAEQQLYVLDQRINDRGVRIDRQLVKNAIECDRLHKDRAMAEAVALTGLSNPNSGKQLKDWLFDETCEVVESLTKETVPEILKATDDETIKRVLQLRQELSKTSVKKYAAMDTAVCPDGRVRGLLQFYGANRTGRWAGRLVQVQNLPQNHLPDLALARRLLWEGDYEMIEVLYGNVQDVLSQLIRTAFIPGDGQRFLVADYSAIEARVIAWLAGEAWRLDVFNTHGKIYEASAAAMFKVPIDSITKASPLRQKGKIAELALGYQGAVGALKTMGALKMGLTEDELPELVSSWRKANQNIVHLWYDTQAAAIKAVKEKTTAPLAKGVSYTYDGNMLFAQLPSGRRLAYARPRLAPGRYGDMLSYEGMNQETKKWERIDTYGGKLTENLVQAIARDCLAEALLRLEKAEFKTVTHVHDEAVIEEPYEVGTVGAKNKAFEYACEVMGQPIKWAPGLPLRADGYETPFYRKED